MYVKSYYHENAFKLKGVPGMSTLNHRKGSISLTTKKVIL